MNINTKIGFKNLDNQVTILELCSDSGILETTGKVLINLYNTTTLAKKLMKEGTVSEASGKLDVSSIVSIDNYEWGLVGTDFSEYAISYANNSSDFLEHHSNQYNFLYMFSEADSEWYVSSNDNQIWRELSSEL